jgi:hypothetical protein
MDKPQEFLTYDLSRVQIGEAVQLPVTYDDVKRWKWHYPNNFTRTMADIVMLGYDVIVDYDLNGDYEHGYAYKGRDIMKIFKTALARQFEVDDGEWVIKFNNGEKHEHYIVMSIDLPNSEDWVMDGCACDTNPWWKLSEKYEELYSEPNQNPT